MFGATGYCVGELPLTARKLLELLLEGDGGVVGAENFGRESVHQLL